MSNINETLFVKPPKEGSTLRCAVCLGILDEPQQLVPCLHVFCLHCSKKLNGKCPLDRLEFTSTIVEKNIRNIIEELDVRCSNLKNGCSWIGEYGKLFSHNKECGFELICCPQCKENILRSNNNAHAEKCAVPCEFSIYGCTAKIIKQNHEQHPANHPSHITILLNQIKELTTRVTKLEEQLENKPINSPRGRGISSSSRGIKQALPSPPSRGINASRRGRVRGVSIRGNSRGNVRGRGGISFPSLEETEEKENEEMFGETLFNLVAEDYPESAGKITGMFFAAFSRQEIMEAIDNPIFLQDKIQEAIELINQFNQ